MSSADMPNPKALRERFAAAAAQGERDRLECLRGDVDRYDLLQSKRSQLRQAVAMFNLSKKARLTGRFDRDAWKAAVADLQDDGQPDWVFFMEAPGRRYRVRPWRQADGEPCAYRIPCITICDVEQCRVLAGVPITGLHSFGIFDRIEDTDAHAALWFAHAYRRGDK